jgi:23S rRNA (uridine2552-2'-O)-methyltransferase
LRLPKAWIRQRKREYYYRRAKEEEYRSRSTYKLLQAVRKYSFIKRGFTVVDLGAAPGGWLQATREIVGEDGFILGVDLKEIEPLRDDNVLTITGDISTEKTLRLLRNTIPSPVDVLISDVSPKVSGAWEVDHARQIDLAHRSLSIAIELVRIGGNFYVKAFQGEMFRDFVKEVGKHFHRVEIFKPKASRPESAEIFVLGLDLKVKE